MTDLNVKPEIFKLVGKKHKRKIFVTFFNIKAQTVKENTHTNTPDFMKVRTQGF